MCHSASPRPSQPSSHTHGIACFVDDCCKFQVKPIKNGNTYRMYSVEPMILAYEFVKTKGLTWRRAALHFRH